MEPLMCCGILISPSTRFYAEACGLCYDKVHDDYKIVVANTRSYTVFSHKNNTWSDLKIVPGNIELDQQYKTYFNGDMYWIGLSYDNTKSWLICFHCGDEKFGDLMELPQGLLSCFDIYYPEVDTTGLFTWRNNLCIYQYRCLDYNKVRIWSLVDGYWEETLSMTLRTFNGMFPINDDKIAMSWFDWDAAYDHMDMEIKNGVYSFGEARFVGEVTEFYSLFPCPKAFFVPTPALPCRDVSKFHTILLKLKLLKGEKYRNDWLEQLVESIHLETIRYNK